MRIINDEEKIKKYIAEHRNIVIYGAGIMGQAFYCICKSWGMQDHIDGFAISSQAYGLPEFMDKPIKSINEYNLKEQVFIVAVKEEYVEAITNNLTETEYVYIPESAIRKACVNDALCKIDELVYDAMNQAGLSDREYVTAYLRQLSKRKLGFEVNVVDHCNLNCQSCNHFSSIATPWYLEIKEFKKDMQRIVEITNGGDIEKLWLLGGEPLLHPQLCEIMELSRKFFSTAPISVFSNGSLLLKQDERFWETVRDNDIELVVTKYPVNIDYDAIDKKAKSEGVKISYSVTSMDRMKVMYHLSLVEESDMEPIMNYLRCIYPNACSPLKEGRIYPCPIAAHAHHFNEKFDRHLYTGECNSISIYDAKDADEIIEFLKTPIPFCKYCDMKNCKFDVPWTVTKKTVEEWT